MLPTAIQEKLPSDMFTFALNYFTRPPADTTKYVTAYKASDDSLFIELSAVQPDVMMDPITQKPISLSTLLSDCPLKIYSNLLQGLLSRSLTLKDGLFPHTASIWTIIINTRVTHFQFKAKR